MSDKAECRMAEGGFICTLLLPDLGFLLDWNVHPKRFIYLRIGGMYIILVFYLFFKFCTQNLNNLPHSSVHASESTACLI
jgi:hypothetical protein